MEAGRGGGGGKRNFRIKECWCQNPGPSDFCTYCLVISGPPVYYMSYKTKRLICRNNTCTITCKLRYRISQPSLYQCSSALANCLRLSWHLLVLNLKQNSMARRHALFLGRHALCDSAMPFFLAPCHQNVPLIKIFTWSDDFWHCALAQIDTSLKPLK